jgi:hypothetical protein
MYKWLKPTGKALFTYACKEYTGDDRFSGYKEFLGERLYYSHHTVQDLNSVLINIGFRDFTTRFKTVGDETFLWVTVIK